MKIVKLLLVLAVFLGLAQARTLEQIKQSGVVKIGVFSDKAPFGYTDEKGEYQGYDVYFAKRIASELGVKAEFLALDPASRVQFAKSDKADIILANFTKTAERAKQVDFALPYMKVSLGVVSPKSALIKSVDELASKSLIVVKGTTADFYFSKNHPEIKLLKFDQYSQAYNALLDGRGAAFSTDNTEVSAWAKVNEGFEVGIGKLGEIDEIAPAVKKGNTELLEWINALIVKLGEEQFFHKNYEETLRPVYGEAANADDIVVEGGKL